MWSTLGLLGRLGMALGADTLSLLTWRSIFAVVLLFTALLIFRRRSLLFSVRSVPLFAALGFCQALDYVAFFQSLSRLPVGVATSLFYVYPALTALLGWAVLRERFSRRTGLALVSAVVGAALVSGLAEARASISWAGVAWALIAAVSYAGYALLVKVAVRERPPEHVLFYSLVFILAFLLLAQPAGGGALFVARPAAAWGVFLLLAIGPTLLGYGLFTLALKRVDLTRASVVATLEPALASLLALVGLGERLAASQILGLLLVVLGAGLAQARGVERARPNRLRYPGEGR